MADSEVNIGRVKRDISELVNRVAYGGERIIFTSRGKPKAALVSLEDYDRLIQLTGENNLSRWQVWLAASERLSIRTRKDLAELVYYNQWREVEPA